MTLSALKHQVRQLKQQTLTVYYAARDPQMPLLIKLLALLVAAYALSPIDLIPDFIPVIGYLDDLILIPLGLALVIRFTPPAVIAAARVKASQAVEKPVSYTAAVVIVVIWVLVLAVVLAWLSRLSV